MFKGGGAGKDHRDGATGSDASTRNEGDIKEDRLKRGKSNRKTSWEPIIGRSLKRDAARAAIAVLRLW